MSTPLKLISLNIERSKHLALVVPFLRHAHADVVCLQELMEYDIARFEVELGLRCTFVPSTIHAAEGRPGPLGNGIFSRQAARAIRVEYYTGGPGPLQAFDTTDVHTKHATQSHPLLVCDVEKDGTTYRIGTTHFTWTPDGAANDYQRTDMQALLALLAGQGEFVLTGDFNAPRGGEMWSELASRYTDHVPPAYNTSLDASLHRAGKERPQELADKMVDGIFSTSAYSVGGVEMVCGVSDHCALVASVSKTG